MPLSSRPTFNRQPLLLLAVCFAIGILIGKFVAVSLLVAAGGVVFCTVAAFIFKKNDPATLFLAAAFVFAGVFAFQAEVLRNNRADRVKVLYDNGTFISGSPAEVEGVLAGRPEPSFEGEFLILRSEKLRYRGNEHNVSGNVRVFVPAPPSLNIRSEMSDLKYGSRVRIACNLDREDEFLNPGVQPRREILDRQNVDATCSLKSAMLVEHLADESVFMPLAWVYDQRATLIDDLNKGLSKPAAGVMIASLLGDKYFLDKQTADLFREGGTFHILVISGLHITFIGGLLLLFLRRITRNRWIQFAVTCGALWAYTLAVGADVPVVRASIMFTIILLGYAIYRQGNLLNSLGLCALLLLAWRPSQFFDPSFQLTFVSVGAIIVIAYPLIEHLRKIGSWTPTTSEPFPPNVPKFLFRFCETIYWRQDKWNIESKRNLWTAKLIKSLYLSKRIGEFGQRILRYLFEGILVSLIVQITMLPLTVVYFHRVSVASVLLNLWVGIFIAIESFAAVAAALLSRVSEIFAYPVFAIADAVNWVMLLLPKLLSGLSGMSFRLPAYSGDGRIFYILFFVPVVICAIAFTKWKPFSIKRPAKFWTKQILPATGITLLLLIAIVIVHPFSAPRADGRLHIDFLDVGQGDSAIVTFPNGETLLIDGGGRFDYREKRDETEEPFEPDTRGIGEAVVSEVLWTKGYSKIDHILATHADADHIKGLGDVATNFNIGSAFVGRTPISDPDYFEFAAVLQKRKIPLQTVSRGEILKFGDVTVEVLYPFASDDLDAASDNNNSVVLRIVYGSRVFLLTGDVEQKAERDLLANGTLRADVVKVAHHGSRTSSMQTFIDATGATYAVISVGQNSQFGHPHAEVVSRWQQSGASVFTTGENGMISFSTDGKDLVVSSFAGGK